MVGNAGPQPTFEKADKAIRPSEAELTRNPRSRSATLRSATRTHAPAWATGGLAA
jgi:16S rRNA (cytosine1402-N4)-methyltransferase